MLWINCKDLHSCSYLQYAKRITRLPLTDFSSTVNIVLFNISSINSHADFFIFHFFFSTSGWLALFKHAVLLFDCYITYFLTGKSKGPFILHRNCVALQHCTALHRNCDVTALWCHMKVKFILTWNAVMLRWLLAESNQYIGTATQLRCSINGP